MNKEMLYLLVKEKLNENKNNISIQISDLIQSRDNETKSSAGDKYETGRAMTQIELDKLKKRLFNTEQMSYFLKKINPKNKEDKARTGALIETNHGSFFISIALGKIETTKNNIIYLISPSSPLSKSMVNLKKGDSFSFQKRIYFIKNIQ